MDTATARDAPTAFLPDATNHRPEPDYLQHLLAKTGLSERAAERLLGFGERSLRNFMQGKTRIPYTLQYCMEVLARSGTSEPPRETGVWFDAKQRPVRSADHDRLIVIRFDDGGLVLGRVHGMGYGVGIKQVDYLCVGERIIGTTGIAEYMLVDGPQS